MCGLKYIWGLVYENLGIHINEEELCGLFSDDVTTSKPFGEKNKSMFLCLVSDN